MSFVKSKMYAAGYFAPVVIEMMLHCHYSPEIHPRADTVSMQAAIATLLHYELIMPQVRPAERPNRLPKIAQTYQSTPRGKVYVDMLCKLPLPVASWASPIDLDAKSEEEPPAASVSRDEDEF